MMTINWRPYQIECLAAVEKNRKTMKRQLIVAATGVGKRLLAIGISKDYKRTLFLCHREELIEQAFRDFNRMYPMDVGIVKGPSFDINKRIVIGSAQTMWRRLDKIPQDHFDCVMGDEIHHFLAQTFIQPLQFFKYKNSFGFTATPTRLDGLNFSNIMDGIVYEYSIDKAIKDKWLCQLDAHRVQTQVDISKVKKVGGDFVQSELSSKIDIPERNVLVVKKYRKYAFGRQAIVFCCDIAHAENMAETFRNDGFAAKAVHSKLDHDERKQAISNFKNKIIDILVNVEILTEGFDYEDVGCICMVRPTQSLSLYMQCLDVETEILTNNGWKNYKTIKKTDKSAAFNLNTQEISYLSINEIFIRDRAVSEDMYSLNLPGINFRITSGHRMIQSKRQKRIREYTPFSFIEANQFANNTDLVKIPVSGYKKSKGLSLTEWELKFLGLYLSDGTFNKKTKQVTISQSEHQIWNEEIVKILNNCGFKYSIYKNQRKTAFSDNSTMLYYNISNAYSKHLLKWIDKDLNKYYNEITPFQLMSLIYGINLGDGAKFKTVNWVPHTFVISSGNKKFADNLQILCLQNGFRSNLKISKNRNLKPIYFIHIEPFKTEKSVNFAKNDKRNKCVKEKDFVAEKVWCINNDLNSIVTRRNGKIVILGNCIGRGTRLKSESFKERLQVNNCVILDFVDNSGNHKLINTWTLDQEKPAEEKVFVTDEQRQKLLDHEEETMRAMEAVLAREKQRKEFLIKRFYKHDKPIDLLELPTLSVNHRGRMLEDATPKQIEWLQALGVWQPGINYSKAQASEYITHSPAPDWMYQKLADWGYNIVDGATVGQYYEIKRRIEEEARVTSGNAESFRPINI